MDFTYDEEQQALREAVRGLVGKAYADFENRRRTVAADPGFDETLWARLAEMGILGLPFAEEDGGMGAGPVEVGIVAQELGRVLAPEPFLTSVVLAGGIVAAAGTAEQRAEVLGALAEGESVLAFAHAEPGTRWAADRRRRDRATPDGDAWTLTGVKEPVPHGARADRLVVSAALPDGGTGPLPGRRRRRRPDPRGLRHPRRRPRRPGRVRRHPRRRRSARRPTGPPRSPGRARPRPGRRLQPGDRRDAGRAGRDHVVPHQPQAVRRHAQHLPGAELPGRRHVRLARAGHQPDRVGDDGARRRRRRGGGRRPPRARACRSAAPAGTSARRRSSCTAASG